MRTYFHRSSMSCAKCKLQILSSMNSSSSFTFLLRNFFVTLRKQKLSSFYWFYSFLSLYCLLPVHFSCLLPVHFSYTHFLTGCPNSLRLQYVDDTAARSNKFCFNMRLYVRFIEHCNMFSLSTVNLVGVVGLRGVVFVHESSASLAGFPDVSLLSGFPLSFAIRRLGEGGNQPKDGNLVLNVWQRL